MLRTVLVGILAVTSAAACSGKVDAPAAMPGATAGKVVELTGTVTATRANQVRTLVAGGEISADDVIDTAADGRVVILLAHNNARWDIGPNKHGKVSESLAWTVAKQNQPAAAVIEESSTAGAHAEKTAATTGSTTEEAKSADSVADIQTEGARDQAAAAPAAQNDRPMKATKAPLTATSSPPSPGPPSSDPESEPEVDRKRTEASRRAPVDTALDKGPAPGGTSSGAALGISSDAVEAVDPVRTVQQEIRSTFAKGRLQMRACFEPTAPNALIQITVTNGVYTITTVGRGATDKARACLATIAKGLSSPTKLAKPVYVKLTLAKP